MNAKPKMKRGRTRENTEDLLMILRAFGPTRKLLAKATREYLKDFPLRRQSKVTVSQFNEIPSVQ